MRWGLGASESETRKMPIRAILMLVPALVVGLLVWFFQESRLGAQLAEVQAESSQYRAEVLAEKASAAERVRKVEGDWNAKYQTAVNSARDRERVLRADLVAVRDAASGLRTQAAEAARRLAQAPAPAVLEYGIVANELFSECVDAYQDMAGKAQSHSADVRLMIDAWPVNPR